MTSKSTVKKIRKSLRNMLFVKVSTDVHFYSIKIDFNRRAHEIQHV